MKNNNDNIITKVNNDSFEEVTDDNLNEVIKGDNRKNKHSFGMIIIIILLFIGVLVGVYFLFFKDKNNSTTEIEVPSSAYLTYGITGNSLGAFDLYFMQLENEKKNKIYSPLSIKYALGMLNEGANGETKEQISNIIGSYDSKKYFNSENMSFANALFVKNSYKDSIKASYIDTLSSKYNANVIYDSFEKPDAINSWVSDKTFKLIDSLFDDVSSEDFILVNALAIDMEWVNKIRHQSKDYIVDFKHEKYSMTIGGLTYTDYHKLEFEDVDYDVNSLRIGAVVNKYDIVNELGEDKIRETVGKEYEEWLAKGECGTSEAEPDTNTYLDKYIKEIDSSYKHVSSSTDFKFYTDDDVKVFAKDLKEYGGTTLQYVGIMPTQTKLDNYIRNIKADDVNNLINNLKAIELDNFKDGVITEIDGYIPTFNFDYELNLIEDLKKLGIVNIFDGNKADLTGISSSNAVIDKAVHKANIEFSNDGIKAAAATGLGGKGAGGCYFEYEYDVPVEKIDLTFDKPYLFIIRDKDTGEVWFAGTVYKPEEIKKSSY